MSDTPIITPKFIEDAVRNPMLKSFNKTRSQMLGEGILMDISEVASNLGVRHNAAILARLFQELFPWAEDANKGIEYHQRVEDMINVWLREFRGSEKSYVEFEFKFDTYIAKVDKGMQISVFPDGKAKTKTLTVFCSLHPGDFSEPVLTFGVKVIKWAGN